MPQVVNQGTILRTDLAVSQTQKPEMEPITEIGSAFSERTDPVAPVVGITGVGRSPACCSSMTAANTLNFLT
jgi:hypothetical protein